MCDLHIFGKKSFGPLSKMEAPVSRQSPNQPINTVGMRASRLSGKIRYMYRLHKL